MKIGDRVLFKDDHYLKEFFHGYCEIIDVKVFMKSTRYTIRTTYLINGKPNITTVTERDIKPVSEIRNDKLKELGI
jgi:hypothetical protein